MSNRSRLVRDIQPAPRSTPRTQQKGSRLLRGVVAGVSALALLFSGLGYASVGRLGSEVAGTGNLQLGGGGGIKHGDAKDGATDILLVGSDSRSDAQGNRLTPEEIDLLHAGDEENDNTDTIMLIRVPNDGSSATAISLPRDTYIHDPEHGNMKINGVYKSYKDDREIELREEGRTDESFIENEAKDAGRRGLIQAVSNLTGITVDHYAEIGLLGFVLFTDAVGGVDVCLNDATYDEYSGADFQAGYQTLGGPQALAFVRQRHGLPRGDLDRIVRQQAFMASLVQKVLSSDTLTNPSKLTELAEAARRSVIIDKDWDIVSFATQLQNLAGGNVRFDTIPVTSVDGVGDYGESIITVDPEEVKAFFTSLLGTKENPNPAAGEQQTPVTVTVLNASQISGLAGSVAGWLRDDGYRVTSVSNAQAGLYTNSQVVAATEDDPAAKELAQKLGGLPIATSTTVDPGSVVVVTAGDYQGPKSDNAFEEEEDTGGTVVGQPGAELEESISPTITAEGNRPQCVN